MKDTSGAHEILQRRAATDYRLAGSGVESDCKKERCFLFQLILFNYFLGIFLRVVGFPASTDNEGDSGIMWDKDTNRARRCFRSRQNADFHRVRARDGRWLCAVAVKAGCGACERSRRMGGDNRHRHRDRDLSPHRVLGFRLDSWRNTRADRAN